MRKRRMSPETAVARAVSEVESRFGAGPGKRRESKDFRGRRVRETPHTCGAGSGNNKTNGLRRGPSAKRISDGLGQSWSNKIRSFVYRETPPFPNWQGKFPRNGSPRYRKARTRPRRKAHDDANFQWARASPNERPGPFPATLQSLLNNTGGPRCLKYI